MADPRANGELDVKEINCIGTEGWRLSKEVPRSKSKELVEENGVKGLISKCWPSWRRCIHFVMSADWK